MLEHHCVVEPFWEKCPQTGRTIGIHCCSDPTCASVFHIVPERMRRWQVSFEGVARFVQRLCGIRHEPVIEAQGRVCWLGGVARGDVCTGTCF